MSEYSWCKALSVNMASLSATRPLSQNWRLSPGSANFQSQQSDIAKTWNLKLEREKKVIMNSIQPFDGHCLWLNTDFSNSFFDQTPTSLQRTVADEQFWQHWKWTWHVLIEINIFLFQLFKVYKLLWAVFTSIKKLWLCHVKQQNKIARRRKMQTKKI